MESQPEQLAQGGESSPFADAIPKAILNVEEFAEIAGVAPATVRSWVHVGRAPQSFRIAGGRRVYFAKADVIAGSIRLAWQEWAAPEAPHASRADPSTTPRSAAQHDPIHPQIREARYRRPAHREDRIRSCRPDTTTPPEPRTKQAQEALPPTAIREEKALPSPPILLEPRRLSLASSTPPRPWPSRASRWCLFIRSGQMA